MEIVHADDLNGFKEFEHNASIDPLWRRPRSANPSCTIGEQGLVRPREGVRAHRVPRPAVRRPFLTARRPLRLQAMDGPGRERSG